jgi:beta-apo-4'-carotenal oxygenase
MASIPELEYTAVKDIRALAQGVRQTFLSHKTKPLEYRLVQLRKLYWGLKDNEAAIAEACKRDLGKSSFETYISETCWVQNDILYVCDNLHKWIKEEPGPDIPLMYKGMSPRVRKEPLGAILVIGAYNFPIQLSLGPLVGAIAAGCTAILKPSESAPAAAALMQKIISDYLDPSAYKVVQGAIPETTELLDQKWDKIFYTGNEKVGTIICKKAAETLTPVTLELGGLNPAIVAKHADPHLAARRLLWNKTFNAGQVCVSHNYTLVDREILPAFVAALKEAFKEYFPKGARESPDYGRIVNARQFARLKKMLDDSSGRILMGGSMDEKDLFIEPTVIEVTSSADPLLADESFGPFLPILAVDNLDEAIEIANRIHETPLALYPFGNKAETTKILDETRSGGATVNDGMFHASLLTMPFGGVGTSGQGNYRGRQSFECFTHRRSVAATPGWMESLLSVRYMPYLPSKEKQYRRMNARSPNFDRNGKATSNALARLIGLGAQNTTSGLTRWVLVLLVALGIRNYNQRMSKL